MKKLDRVAFIFPAKCKLLPGVGLEYYNKYPQVKEYFEIASEVQKFDFKKYLLNGDFKEYIPVVTEFITLLISISKYWAWVYETSTVPEVFSGLSLGLYTSMITSGAVKVEDGLKLLKFSVDVGTSFGGRAALISGLNYDEVSSICEIPELKGKVFIANYNSKYQIMIAGTEKAVDLSLKIAEKRNALETRWVYNSQFHTPVMKPYANQMFEIMKKMDVSDLEIPILFLYDLKRINTKEEAIEHLSRQFCSMIRWYEGVKLLMKDGIDVFIEFSPKEILNKGLKLLDKKLSYYYFDSLEEMIILSEKLKLKDGDF